MSKKSKQVLLYLALAFYVIAVGFLIRDRYLHFASDDFANQGTSISVKPKTVETKEPEKVTPLPAEVLLEVPFLVQAPFGVWDELHGEACEEASLIMVKYFRDKKTFNSPAEADGEIKDLIAWQTDNGYKVDITVSQVSRVAADYYNMKTGRVINDPTVESIKRELADGRPVIVPAAGRLLPNPYFTPPGPPYHMLVIKGYDQDGFITNDPGTRRGESFRYSFNSLMEAIHDWEPGNILNGQKAVLVFD